MGTLVGHVAPGCGFLLIGLWHFFSHIRLFSVRPKSYVAPPWFPSPLLRHLELILIILGSLASISMELFIGPEKHQPFDDDGTIPSNHLHNFEHASISLTFLIYAAFTIYFDRIKMKERDAMSQFLGAIAFAQQLLIFHLHSADHMGVEGQYHWLLQTVIAISLATTLLNIPFPKSIMVSFVRSVSIAFQGIWFIVMGIMLWTPSLIPKGCYLNIEEDHQVMRCHTTEALHRAKSLVNIQFSWYMTGTVVLAILGYVYLTKFYPEEPDYLPLVRKTDEEDDDLEMRKLGN
ncbi:hypothetical protein LUZ62_052265 [Rhynchospora pubera]|uniref:Transmembrane protein 45A-like n=1 Tax=Rhynchospora pubera TaxID=906938 RepID=A0AAV8G5P1_9POAL|nr:hypothetical protein LUZ62_052265 [Rhynchospora pubera]